MTLKFINVVCDILQITLPEISYDISSFTTPTMMAQCSSNGDTIILTAPNNPTPDYYFAIAHELRHIWQIRTNYTYYLSDYKTANVIGIEEYNSQIAEVDANAFAAIIMMEILGLKPQFDNLSDNVKSLIFEQVSVIANELNSQDT